MDDIKIVVILNITVAVLGLFREIIGLYRDIEYNDRKPDAVDAEEG